MDSDAVRDVRRVHHGGESDPSILDFSANVNPRTPAGVSAVYADALEASRRYPDDEYRDYRAAAAEYVGASDERVIPTPGGLAAIRLACEVSLEPGDEALIPYPSFGEYAREARLQGAIPRFVPHDELLTSGAEALEAAALAVVCTPNNPTGEAVEPAALEAFAERCDECGTTLLVDEAFLGFTDLPSLAAADLERAIVVRSLTKLFGLPGLRAGFAVATGEQLESLQTARRAWSLGTPAARVGVHCMRDGRFVRETRSAVSSERERLRGTLETIEWLDTRKSDAPFLLLDVGERSVTELVRVVRDRGIAVRDATTFRGLESHVRVAVKGRDANDRLLEVLADA